MEELKPCPMCGGEAITLYSSRNDKWAVACKECQLLLGYLESDYYGDYFEFNTQEEAIKAWNKRIN